MKNNLIAKKGRFYSGLGLLCAFVLVLTLIFLPLFQEKNALEYLDSLYNSISKGSAYYIPKVKKDAGRFMGTPISVTLAMKDEKQAQQTALLFVKGGSSVDVSGNKLEITGDLGAILMNCLADADNMYANDGKAIFDKYGYDERQTLFNWWNATGAMDRELKKQKKFNDANVVILVREKAVEASYNYYKIEPQSISDRAGVVIFSLLFYVVYTVLYGFAIMYLFEGWGLILEH
jgi:hypothetical protein